ncbi:MAG TPA: acyl-CoA dehydrogenase family protein [Candidatus Binataceae bacterium]|nr:acyl-CoA dehydrogenase family protein [Candidatus Binataceae bacterium]
MSSEQSNARQVAAQFAKRTLRPSAAPIDGLKDPAELIAQNSPLWKVLKAAYRAGYHAAILPKAIGGMGLDGVGQQAVFEELGYGCSGLALALLATAMPFAALARLNDEGLSAEFLRAYVSDVGARAIGGWPLAEGSDAIAAHSLGDYFVLRGILPWVANGAIATHALVFARLEGELAVFFAPLRSADVIRTPAPDQIGQRGLTVAELRFAGVKLPRRLRICSGSLAEQLRLELKGAWHAVHGAVATGLARAALMEALEHCRQTLYAGKPVSEHIQAQHELFEMFAWVEACRALSRAALERIDATLAEGAHYALAAQLFCANAALRVAGHALPLFGKHALRAPIELFFRDARAACISYGETPVLWGAKRVLAEALASAPN